MRKIAILTTSCTSGPLADLEKNLPPRPFIYRRAERELTTLSPNQCMIGVHVPPVAYLCSIRIEAKAPDASFDNQIHWGQYIHMPNAPTEVMHECIYHVSKIAFNHRPPWELGLHQTMFHTMLLLAIVG